MSDGSFYVPLESGRFQPTAHVQGAWHDHEQHMAPVSGLIAHAIDLHDARPGMILARITFDILGVIPAEVSEVTVTTIRPGRTIELLDATMLVQDRPVVRARAWRLATHESEAAAGGADEPMPPPEVFGAWDGTQVWKGGYIASLDIRSDPANIPGRGRTWIRTDIGLVEGVDVSPTAAYVGLLDTANGMVVREDPRRWMFPNVDLSVHLFREPVPGWVGFDTNVVFAADGLGLTSTVLHDGHGPVGRSAQSLTVRALPATD